MQYFQDSSQVVMFRAELYKYLKFQIESNRT